MASNRLWGNRKEKIIILDTSAILTPFEFSIDLDQELKRIVGKFHIIIPNKVKDELIFFSKNIEGKKGKYAKAALDFIKDYELVETEEKNADDQSTPRDFC